MTTQEKLLAIDVLTKLFEALCRNDEASLAWEVRLKIEEIFKSI